MTSSKVAAIVTPPTLEIHLSQIQQSSRVGELSEKQRHSGHNLALLYCTGWYSHAKIASRAFRIGIEDQILQFLGEHPSQLNALVTADITLTESDISIQHFLEFFPNLLAACKQLQILISIT